MASAITAAGVGYLTARIFTTASPIAGAAFCATTNLVSGITSKVFKNEPLLDFISSFASGLAVANLIGRVTVMQAIALNLLGGITLLGLNLIFPFIVVGASVLNLARI